MCSSCRAIPPLFRSSLSLSFFVCCFLSFCFFSFHLLGNNITFCLLLSPQQRLAYPGSMLAYYLQSLFACKDTHTHTHTHTLSQRCIYSYLMWYVSLMRGLSCSYVTDKHHRYTNTYSYFYSVQALEYHIYYLHIHESLRFRK